MNSICPPACLLNVYFLAKLSNKTSHSLFCKSNRINLTASPFAFALFRFLGLHDTHSSRTLWYRGSSRTCCASWSCLQFYNTTSTQRKNTTEAVFLKTFHLNYFDIRTRIHTEVTPMSI